MYLPHFNGRRRLNISVSSESRGGLYRANKVENITSPFCFAVCLWISVWMCVCVCAHVYRDAFGRQSVLEKGGCWFGEKACVCVCGAGWAYWGCWGRQQNPICTCQCGFGSGLTPVLLRLKPVMRLWAPRIKITPCLVWATGRSLPLCTPSAPILFLHLFSLSLDLVYIHLLWQNSEC